ncbi:MAG: hypothetical protein WCT23_09725 [Candidatus Neomarinimicrobiota bacterium]
MSKLNLILALAIAGSCFGLDGEAKALERLSLTTDRLQAMGDEMAGEPASGMLVVGDTLLIDANLSSTYIYSFIIWTDSAFNFVDFWLASPLGTTPRGDYSDHTILAVMPDSAETGTWQLGMELLEGAYSDTAWYAAAIFRNERVSHKGP